MNITVTRAKNLLRERVDSLGKDVKYCIIDNEGQKNWPAPFPALLYCFSTIDLLGALYWKCNLSDSVQQNKCNKNIEDGVTNKSFNYMIDFMKYPELEAKLIQKVFRHKLVHLAQPLPIEKYKGVKYSWKYHHNNRTEHLSILSNSTDVKIFNISIWSLVEDIEYSIFGANGYFSLLSSESKEGEALRASFDKVYEKLSISS